jgi:cell division FtsZ-interacting protein ZapD
MEACEKKKSRLIALLYDTLRASEELLSFSQQRSHIVLGEDDAEIIETLIEREEYINALISLENEIDIVLEEDGSSDSDLPPEAEKIRLSIRYVLDKVTEIDVEAINVLSENLKKYKEYTIIARNKKRISAYIRTSNISYSVRGMDLVN